MRGRLDANCKLLAEVLEEELQALGQLATQPKPESTEQQRLEAIFTQIHALEPGRSALCLSGGGIRSAAYGLGILQGLARLKLLQQFDYLSTVSGGGYAGAWLSAWIKNRECQRRAAQQDPAAGRDEVFELLKNEPPRAPLKPEPDPISHLRTFSNYLTPKLGILSADTWTLAAIFLRNLLLNWLVLLSWLAVVLVLPRFSLLAIMGGRILPPSASQPPRDWCSSALPVVMPYSICLGWAMPGSPRIVSFFSTSCRFSVRCSASPHGGRDSTTQLWLGPSWNLSPLEDSAGSFNLHCLRPYGGRDSATRVGLGPSWNLLRSLEDSANSFNIHRLRPEHLPYGSS